jgi:hypothetical protein
MATRNPPLVPVLLASVLGVATGWLAPQAATAQAPVRLVAAGPVAAEVTGTLAPIAATVPAGVGSAAERASEGIVFAGQASISGRVIHDDVFGAPPVLEVIVDLGSVTAKGMRSGLAYQVQQHSIVRRPLQPFEQMEVDISLVPQGDVLQARSAVASFGVHYSVAKGLTTTPVKIEPHRPS